MPDRQTTYTHSNQPTHLPAAAATVAAADDQKCIHLPQGSGQTSVNFEIHLGKCGMTSSEAPTAAAGQQLQAAHGQQPAGLFIENTIIIQYDHQVQEIYDQARRLRCTWYDYYEKSVTFRPYNVDMLDAVTANFLGDNIQCWMQIQNGRGPWASEVAGIVKIGQTMTMVLAIKDDENRFDMLVRNCVAHDGKHAPIQLVDEFGCVARPKIMSKFAKVRNFGPAATVVSYAHFQAFKFPDSMSVHFQCVIQVCRYDCPEPVCAGAAGQLAAPDAPPAPTSDYAAAGTEMVASKEPPLPLGYFGGGAANHSSANVNLKLDESQGRVQVKLDTSMLAALGNPATARQQQQQANGPLPPHLLHLHQHQQPEATRPIVYQQPQQQLQTQRASSAAFVASSPAKSFARQQLAAPSGGAAGHYSAPFNSAAAAAAAGARRSSYTNRVGELAAENLLGAMLAAPYENDVAPQLSLLATPRGLRSPIGTASLGAAAAAERFKRHAPSGADEQLSTTSIKTQRTIQVVSPDDVAFSLVSGDADNPEEAANSAPNSSRTLNRRKEESAVCFSPVRFLVGLFVTIATLVCCISIATFVILRQRSQLEQKLSAVFEPTQVCAEQQVAPATGRRQSLGSGGSFPATSSDFETEQRHQLRLAQQRKEIQRRNNYLARLYSQFAPAAYWS